MKIGNKLASKNIYITNGLRFKFNTCVHDNVHPDVIYNMHSKLDPIMDDPHELLFRLFSGTIQ